MPIRALYFFVTIFLALSSLSTRAIAEIPQILVKGVGEASAPTTGFTMTIAVTGLAKTLGDAREEYETELRQVTDAAKALSEESLDIERGSPVFAVVPPGRRTSSRQPAQTTQFSVSEEVLFRSAADADPASLLTSATALLDGLADRDVVGCKWQDAQGYFSSSNINDARSTAKRYVPDLFHTLDFEADDEEELERRATRAAIAKGRAEATRLAELVGVKLDTGLHFSTKKLRVHWDRSSKTIKCTVDVDVRFSIEGDGWETDRTVSASGDGSVAGTPDFVAISVVNRSGGESSQRLVETLGKRLRLLEKVLAGLDLTHAPIESTGVVLYARRRGNETHPQTRRFESMAEHLGIYGPAKGDLSAGEVLEARIDGVAGRDLSEVLDIHTAVIDELLETELLVMTSNAPQGAVPMADVGYGMRATADKEDEALVLAINSARKRAETAAELLGRKLGPVVQVTSKRPTWSNGPGECRCEVHVDLVFSMVP